MDQQGNSTATTYEPRVRRRRLAQEMPEVLSPAPTTPEDVCGLGEGLMLPPSALPLNPFLDDKYSCNGCSLFNGHPCTCCCTDCCDFEGCLSREQSREQTAPIGPNDRLVCIGSSLQLIRGTPSPGTPPCAWGFPDCSCDSPRACDTCGEFYFCACADGVREWAANQQHEFSQPTSLPLNPSVESSLAAIHADEPQPVPTVAVLPTTPPVNAVSANRPGSPISQVEDADTSSTEEEEERVLFPSFCVGPPYAPAGVLKTYITVCTNCASQLCEMCCWTAARMPNAVCYFSNVYNISNISLGTSNAQQQFDIAKPQRNIPFPIVHNGYNRFPSPNSNIRISNDCENALRIVIDYYKPPALSLSVWDTMYFNAIRLAVDDASSRRGLMTVVVSDAILCGEIENHPVWPIGTTSPHRWRPYPVLSPHFDFFQVDHRKVAIALYHANYMFTQMYSPWHDWFYIINAGLSLGRPYSMTRGTLDIPYVADITSGEEVEVEQLFPPRRN